MSLKISALEPLWREYSRFQYKAGPAWLSSKNGLLGKWSNTSINEEAMLKQHTLLSETLLPELKIYEALGIYSSMSVKEPIMF